MYPVADVMIDLEEAQLIDELPVPPQALVRAPT